MLTALYRLGLPISSHSWTRVSGHLTLGQNTLRIQVHVGTNVEPGRGRGTRWSWTRFPVERGEGEQPLLTDPEQNQCGKCGRLGHNSRTCHWPLSQVKITNVSHACLLVPKSYLFVHIKLICTLSLYFVGWSRSTCWSRTTRRTTEDDSPWRVSGHLPLGHKGKGKTRR